MKFYATRKEGKLRIENFSNLKDYLKTLDGGIEIKIRPTKDIRSLKMNNLYFWWLTIIANETGYTKKELHNYFKAKLLCLEEKFLDEFIINCYSTSELSVKDFAEYLEGVVRIAAEIFHVALPDPDKLVF